MTLWFRAQGMHPTEVSLLGAEQGEEGWEEPMENIRHGGNNILLLLTSGCSPPLLGVMV